MSDNRYRVSDQNWIDERRRKRMGVVDEYPADVRACVHEYGLNVTKTLYDIGITKARHIRHVVETVLNEFSPTRGTFSAQGIAAPTICPAPPAQHEETTR